jgi:acetoacetate decarboxylase
LGKEGGEMNTNEQIFKMMPLLLDPISFHNNPFYAETEIVSLQYLTDAETIQPLLPKCFEPGDKPSVTVVFQDSKGVDFLAGNDYRLFMIAVSAKFTGEKHHLEGSFVLVMFENAAIPIILGRERLGLPKIYADITPLRIMENGHLRCEASLWGHPLIGLDLTPQFKKQNPLVRKAAGDMMSRQPGFSYKYIPPTTMYAPPDVDYPTAIYSDYKFDQLWLGKTGSIFIGDPTAEDIGYFKPIIDALRTIPVREVTMVSRSRGTMVIRNDKCHRLL